MTVQQNILLRIEYDGTEFAGWQRQPHMPTIQATIEDVLRKFTKKKIVLYGASRTDSGVHARGQVANFEVEPKLAPERWASFLNWELPKSIRILDSKEVPLRFHAQKMAISKVYEYRILERSSQSPLERASHFNPLPLDWAAIKKAMPYFLGEHDFRAFQGARATVVTTVRQIHRFELFKEQGGLYRFEIEGNGFLKQMVRAIIGTLLEIGEGKRSPDEIPEIIKSLDRRRAGRTADPRGLCLLRVNY